MCIREFVVCSVVFFVVSIGIALADPGNQIELTPNIHGLDKITHTAISPDGRFAATGTLGGDSIAVSIWDRFDARLIRATSTSLPPTTELDEHYHIGFSQDNKYLEIISIADDKKEIFKIIDIFRTEIPNVKESNYNLSGDSFVIFPKHQKSYDELSEKTKKILHKGCLKKYVEGGNFYLSARTAVSDDGTLFSAALLKGGVIVCDIRSGKKILSTSWVDFPDVDGWAPLLIISPDNKYLFANTIIGDGFLIDIEKNKKITTFDSDKNFQNLDQAISAAVFSPDGQSLLVGRGNGSVEEISLSGDGNRPYGNSPFVGDQISLTGKNCQLSKNDLMRTMECTQSFIGSGSYDISIDRSVNGVNREPIAIGPDGSTMFLRSESYIGSVDVKNYKAGSQVPIPKDSEDLKVIFGSDTDDLVLRFKEPVNEVLYNKIYIWHRKNGILKLLSVSENPIYKVVLSASGDLVSVFNQGLIEIINTKSSKVISSITYETAGGDGDWGTASIFTPDEKYLIYAGAFSELKMARISDSVILKDFIGHNAPVNALSLSSDSSLLVSGSKDNTVRLWQISTGRLLGTFVGHTGEVTAVAISSDGQTIYSAGADGTFRQWDRKSGNLLVTRYLFANGEWITMTPEGFFDASRYGAKSISLVFQDSVQYIDQVYDQLYRPDLVREKLAGDPNGLVKAAAAKINLDIAIGSGSPPLVSFVEAPATVDADKVVLKVKLEDQGGGTGKIEWRVNGVTVGLDTRGVGRLDTSSSADGIAAQEIQLSQGENTVEVVAYNAKGLVASVPVSVKITSTASPSSGTGKLYVLAIGVNDYYDSRLELNYAVPDAQAIAAGFEKAKGTVYDSVEATLVTDANVTPDKLETAFAEIGTKVRPQDTFVLFVAGHGKTVDGRYYYLPRDFRYRDEKSFENEGIGQNKFQEWLARVKAQRSVLLFDTCESGSLTDDTLALRGVERAVAMEKMTAAMGRTTIAASSDTKPALEGYQGHGVFTYAVLQGFEEADSNNDGDVDVLELIGYLDHAVPKISDAAFKQRQIPQAKFSGNNFLLSAKTTIVSASKAGAPSVDAPNIVPPIKPTHVIIAPTDVVDAIKSTSIVQTLLPGTLVTIRKTQDGWGLIARDGKDIGYLEMTKIAALQ